MGGKIAFTRCCFTSKLYCASQLSLHCSPPPTKPTLMHAILLHDHCAIYVPPIDLPYICHTPYNIGHGNIV